MSQTTPPLNAAAVLVWVTPGEAPTLAAFDLKNVQGPPHPNPEAWWLAGQAIEYAVQTIVTDRHHGKEPWIKVGDVLFTPSDVKAIYSSMQHQRGKLGYAAWSTRREAPWRCSGGGYQGRPDQRRRRTGRPPGRARSYCPGGNRSFRRRRTRPGLDAGEAVPDCKEGGGIQMESSV
jgi:hypothetical protein